MKMKLSNVEWLQEEFSEVAITNKGEHYTYYECDGNMVRSEECTAGTSFEILREYDGTWRQLGMN
jgi:hypothetical protein